MTVNIPSSVVEPELDMMEFKLDRLIDETTSREGHRSPRSAPKAKAC
jgi:hypothetical protein